jgi:hypothetical protein
MDYGLATTQITKYMQKCERKEKGALKKQKEVIIMGGSHKRIKYCKRSKTGEHKMELHNSCNWGDNVKLSGKEYNDLQLKRAIEEKANYFEKLAKAEKEGTKKPYRYYGLETVHICWKCQACGKIDYQYPKIEEYEEYTKEFKKR